MSDTVEHNAQGHEQSIKHITQKQSAFCQFLSTSTSLHGHYQSVGMYGDVAQRWWWE